MSEKTNMTPAFVITAIFMVAAIVSVVVIHRSNITRETKATIFALQAEQEKLENSVQRCTLSRDTLREEVKRLSARKKELEISCQTVTNYVTITNKVIPIKLIQGDGTNNLILTFVAK